MIAPVTLFELTCDSCSYVFDYDGESPAVFGSVPEAEVTADSYGWTADGEGKHHCGDCPPLNLTEEAVAERARVAAAVGAEPLEGL